MDPVTDDLRRDILSGRFEPGERLLEIQLSEQYACGRAAIRSALVTLAAEGLVAREANRGAIVRRISLTEAIQITEARTALESLIARQAASAASTAERDELRSIVKEMELAVEGSSERTYSELNRLLHRRLREVSGHDVAAQLVSNLRNRAAHHQYRLAVMPGRSEESLTQHAAIVDAVVAGDGDAAAEAMTQHLQSVVDVLQRWEH
jgi:DNA-binding GntR family transcriptional regulator